MKYQIKITGDGTREEIAKALRVIADAIHHPHSKGDGLNVYIGDHLECEDYSLMTEITKL
jgi:hypothetical protein